MPKQMGRSGFIGRGWWSDAADAPPSSGADVGLEEVAENGGDFADDDAEAEAAGAEFAIEFIVVIGPADEEFFDFGPPFFEAFSMRVARISPVAEKAVAHLGPLPKQAAVLELGVILIKDAVFGHAANGW